MDERAHPNGCVTDRPCWHPVRPGLRKRADWRGITWTAWRMGWDQWLVERNGREVSHGLMDWTAVQYLLGARPVEPDPRRTITRELPEDAARDAADAPW